jgi:tetratricopeptide (TPR) repeat protein
VKTRALLSILVCVVLGFSVAAGCAKIEATRHFEAGKRLTKAGEHQKAIREFEQVVALDPTNDQAFEALGLNYGRLGSFDTAAGYFEKALELDPESRLYLFNLAATYMKLEKYTEAKATYLRLLSVDRDNESAKSELKKLERLGY